MRLKSLEIQGFKSFPDKTLFSFDDGVTVIIGPNGSGKSNIAEAVKWVLGELSSKSIRGNKMEDIIFGGTDNRRPMNYAQVSLIIDNTTDEEFGRLDIDYDEVVITRRYYRNGESDYMINHKSVRLKDITELFMNTGIGHSSYSIVGQGKVAEIISQRSDERRNVFEEAAGISKYRYKKNEAERKLKVVDENTIRINDILSELESRVESLRTEAERARLYLDAYENKKRADVSIFLYEIKNLREQLKSTNDRYKITEHELEIADDNLSMLEKQTESLYLKAQDNKLKIEQAERKIREYTAKINEFDSNNKVLANDIKHINNEIEQNQLDIKIKINALDTMKSKNQSLADNFNDLNSMLNQFTSEYDKANELCDKFSLEINLLNEQINEKTKIRNDLNDLNVENQILLSSLDEKYNMDASKSTELKNELDELNKQTEFLSDRIDKSVSIIKNHTTKTEIANSEIEIINDEINNKSNGLNAIINRINTVRLETSTLNQRIDTLKRMDELFEGYSRSVRYVMNCVANESLSGIYGPISMLINVKPKYIVAIETAVGNNLQNIVAENETAAKNAINMLKSNNAGRATFYPLTSIQSQTFNFDDADMKRYSGYIGIASELVACDDKFRHVIDYMLGRTLVFDNIDNASYIAKAYNYRTRIVTLDGQLINAGGSYTGGSVKRDSGMLSRSAEIKRLESDVVKHDILLKTHKTESAEIENSIKTLQSQRDEIQKNINILNNQYQAEYTQLQVLQSQVDNNHARVDTLKKAIVNTSDNIEEHIRQQNKIKKSLYDNNEQIFVLNDNISESVKKREEFTAEYNLNINNKNDLFVKLTEQRKDVEIARNSLKLNEESLKSIEEQISKTEQFTYSRHEQIIELNNKIENNKIESVALTKDCKNLEIEYENRRLKSAEFDKESEDLKGRTRELTNQRETLFREHTKTESQRNQIISEQDKLISRIWEDYELTYSSASELNYPQIDAESKSKMTTLQNESRTKLREIGSVNVNAIDEYREVNERYLFLTEQLDDLNKSKIELNNIIYRLENEMRLKFTAAMKDINSHFKVIFRELFDGGNAELSLTSPDNILESGIEINVAPPGKIIKNLSLLSGGEQAFVAIALLFAILKVNPSPFCVFDEIESALDEVNVIKFAEYCRRYSNHTQFIIITHRRGSMEAADVLYGVTMYEKGVSKALTLNINEAMEKIGEK